MSLFSKLLGFFDKGPTRQRLALWQSRGCRTLLRSNLLLGYTILTTSLTSWIPPSFNAMPRLLVQITNYSHTC